MDENILVISEEMGKRDVKKLASMLRRDENVKSLRNKTKLRDKR
jgi:hypothetical protein